MEITEGDQPLAMDGYGWLWMAPGLSQAQVPQTSFSRELFQT